MKKALAKLFPLVRNEKGISLLQVLALSVFAAGLAGFFSTYAYVAARREELLRKQTVQGEISRQVRFFAANRSALDWSANPVAPATQPANPNFSECLNPAGNDCDAAAAPGTPIILYAATMTIFGNNYNGVPMATEGNADNIALFDTEGRRCVPGDPLSKECMYSVRNARVEILCEGGAPTCARFGLLRFTWQVVQAFTATAGADRVYQELPPLSDAVAIGYVNYAPSTTSIDSLCIPGAGDCGFLLANLPMMEGFFHYAIEGGHFRGNL